MPQYIDRRERVSPFVLAAEKRGLFLIAGDLYRSKDPRLSPQCSPRSVTRVDNSLEPLLLELPEPRVAWVCILVDQ